MNDKEVIPKKLCPHCGKNLFKVGITEVIEGGHCQTDITFVNGHESIGESFIQNADELYLTCGNCEKRLDDEYDKLLNEYEIQYAELCGVDINDDGRQ